MPVGAASFSEALRCGAEIFHALKSALHAKGLSTAVGDEGGFAPNIASARAALDFIARGDRERRLQAGRRRAARARLRRDRIFQGRRLRHGQARGGRCRPSEMADYLAELAGDYPIASIEDGMAEDDMAGWKALTDKLGDRVQLVGDDLFVTNETRLAEGIARRHRQFDPGQGQPDRHADRDDRRGPPGAVVGLYRGDVAPLGRDRGFDHRRPRRRARLRPDQDRQPGALRPHRQVQPAAADRGRAGRRRALSGRCGAASAYSAGAKHREKFL